MYFLCQEVCNYLQRLLGRSGATLAAISANFQPAHHDMEAAIALNLSLETVEQIAFEFHDLSTTQARHVNVIALGTTLVIMFFSLHVHEIEFIDQAVALEKTKSAIHGNAIDSGVKLACVPENLRGIEVLLGGFHHAENRASLVSESHPA